ncbi:MAG: YraN family protein [Patescibacteria group bacterium]|nr:YraN family protein [Patescibacteria group bacterium]
MQFLGGKDGIEIFLNKMNLGKRAENFVCQYLISKGFEIIKKNWWLKRYGEIDIIARKNNRFYFFEVKSLNKKDNFHPVFNYTVVKKRKFYKLINYYVNKNKINEFYSYLATVEKKDDKYSIKFFLNA